MDDVYVDVDDIVDIEDDNAEDVFVDIRSIVSGRSYDDDIVKTYPGRKPSDYVSFRYSRFDRYTPGEAIRNPVLERYREVQKIIDSIAASGDRHDQQKKAMVALLNTFKQELRQKNIRYRNLWRNLDFHDIVKIK